jgi:hypothetical protein
MLFNCSIVHIFFNDIEKKLHSRRKGGTLIPEKRWPPLRSLLSAHLLPRNLKIKIFKLLLRIFSYRHEICLSGSLREEHRLMIFDKTSPRIIFSPKREKVTGSYRPGASKIF